MRITRYTDYSLRVLIYVGLTGSRLVTIGDIARSYGISKNHLMKVVHELNLLGYLETVRGKHGGVCLRRPPETINIGALVRDTESDLALVECFEGTDGCAISPACRLHGVMADALAAFFAVLDGYTLADLLPPADRPQLLRLLGIDFGRSHSRQGSPFS
jgi:Rrf2 family transcriptional regulator, nitric oxide-sensitive transcriptional repressor